MHRQGLTLIPGRLHHWTGADVENLADSIQLSQPAKQHGKGQFSITAVVEQRKLRTSWECTHAPHQTQHLMHQSELCQAFGQGNGLLQIGSDAEATKAVTFSLLPALLNAAAFVACTPQSIWKAAWLW